MKPTRVARQLRAGRARSPDAGGERALIERLRDGDEEAFLTVVARYNPMMLRFATALARDRTIAEEIVQDVWLGVVRGIERFEGRSSLRTWLLRILVNRAHSTRSIERRSVPVGDPGTPLDAACFDAEGNWAAPLVHWVDDCDDRLDAAALSARIWSALDELPDRQRQVILLRDVDGLTSAEVRDVLALTEANQRVLLHRARRHLRRALEPELART